MARSRGRDSHSSGTPVARRLAQPTRTAGLETGLGLLPDPAVPIRSCSRWGLPCRRCYQLRGGLLLHPFTLTPDRSFDRGRGGLLSVALSLRSPSPGVTRHRVSLEPGLSSPAAFRRLRQRLSGRLALADLSVFVFKVKRHRTLCDCKTTRFVCSFHFAKRTEGGNFSEPFSSNRHLRIFTFA